MPEKAFVTPTVLTWSRKTARMSLSEAAEKLNVSEGKIQSWEDGKDKPTLLQAEKLARIYRRPFAIFFLPEPPLDFKPLQDFRRKNSKPLSTAAAFIMREIQQKQAWAREIAEENGEKVKPFYGKFSISDDPKLVARDILQTLNINPSSYSSSYSNPIAEWTDKIESIGVFISKTSFINSRLLIDSEEMQGFVIADAFAPFIFINTDDWSAPLLFTLVHELAHVWIAETGISNEVGHNDPKRDKFHPVETFCNEVAAAALIPTKAITETDFTSIGHVSKAARALGVSSFAFIVRAYLLGTIDVETYNVLKIRADSEYHAFLKRQNDLLILLCEFSV